MKKKPGRKRKASAGTYVGLNNAIMSRPKATDADLAEVINVRPSQATDEELTQPESPARKITIKGTLKFDAKDIQRMRTSGARAQKKNVAGNRRGMGRRNNTVQIGKKKAAEWDPEDGASFLEERDKYNPCHIAHFDTTHFPV